MAGKKQPPRENPECSVCKVALSDTNWTPSCQKSRRYICSKCWVERQKRYAEKDPLSREKKQECSRLRRLNMSDEQRLKEDVRRRDRYLLRTYGIDLNTYNKMVDCQKSRCKICSTTTPGGKGYFHVDHCHTTGNVRGLLCMNCNMMLGLVYDKTDVLKKAIKYLEASND